jgi:hypothetical protein
MLSIRKSLNEFYIDKVCSPSPAGVALRHVAIRERIDLSARAIIDVNVNQNPQRKGSHT